jgi:Polyketide cyclase / dehydrase and lipid transport
MLWFIIILAVAALLFWISRKPSHFSLARSITINATPAQIHPWINNLKQMNQWNPWAGQDAKSKISYEGPESGPGAIYTWAGGKMGEGRFEIKDVNALAITARLLMIKPMAADNTVVYTLQPDAAATKVTWTMSGENRFIHKLMHTVMNMDKMVGKEFDKGLAGLKSKVEQKTLN